MIPKPSGGMRKLGVPAAVDRFICQAIAQVLTPVGCVQRNDHEHERPDARLRVRPFPATTTTPAGSTASADFSTASRDLTTPTVPHHPTNAPRSADGHPGTPVETSPNKTNGLPRAPPRLRNDPLMDIGLRHAEPARPDRPALYAQPARSQTIAARHVFLGSRFRLRLPSHPASRRRGCHWLVVGAINLHRGLSPPSCWSCWAYSGRPSASRRWAPLRTGYVEFHITGCMSRERLC